MNAEHLQEPSSAPARADLPFLRHRRAKPPIDYVHHSEPEQTLPEAPAADADLLDLSPEPAPGPDSPAAPGRSEGPPRRHRPRTLPYPRVSAGTPVVLAADTPTVTLTRLQAGLGQLHLSLTTGTHAGDFAMGMICESADGVVHVLQRLGEAHSTPERPVPMARLEADDALVFDQRQVANLRRALLYGYSPSVAVLDWEGLVVLAAQDGSRVEVPVDLAPFSGVVAMVTLYNVFGELVIRSEHQGFSGPPEQAAEAYGYRYGWLDGRLPSR